MQINAKFDQRVVVHSQHMNWLDSPMSGVSRRPLDRVGNEVARATSIVRYAPNSHFSPHIHTGGEEFLVLEGVFEDEHGEFPAGSYIRNPPQSQHQPHSTEGCIIFVKLWQFEPDDRTHVRLNPHFMKAVPYPNTHGVVITPLYYDRYEEVSLLDLSPQAYLELEANGGIELLVLEGGIIESGDTLTQYSWLRAPSSPSIAIQAGESGAKLWVKQGHLNDVKQQIARVHQHQ